jgi:hypothetical protein
MKTLFELSKTLPQVTEVPQASMAILNCGFTKVYMSMLSEEYKSILLLTQCYWPGPHTVTKVYEVISKEINVIHMDSHIYCLADNHYRNIKAKKQDYSLAT